MSALPTPTRPGSAIGGRGELERLAEWRGTPCDALEGGSGKRGLDCPNAGRAEGVSRLGETAAVDVDASGGGETATLYADIPSRACAAISRLEARKRQRKRKMHFLP